MRYLKSKHNYNPNEEVTLLYQIGQAIQSQENFQALWKELK